MKKVFAATVLFLLLASTARAWDTVRILTAPPDRPYTEIGRIIEKRLIGNQIAVTTGILGGILQSKAATMGANALIIEKTYLVPGTLVQPKNDMDPFSADSDLLGVCIQIEALAILVE